MFFHALAISIWLHLPFIFRLKSLLICFLLLSQLIFHRFVSTGEKEVSKRAGINCHLALPRLHRNFNSREARPNASVCLLIFDYLKRQLPVTWQMAWNSLCRSVNIKKKTSFIRCEAEKTWSLRKIRLVNGFYKWSLGCLKVNLIASFTRSNPKHFKICKDLKSKQNKLHNIIFHPTRGKHRDAISLHFETDERREKRFHQMFFSQSPRAMQQRMGGRRFESRTEATCRILFVLTRLLSHVSRENLRFPIVSLANHSLIIIKSSWLYNLIVSFFVCQPSNWSERISFSFLRKWKEVFLARLFPSSDGKGLDRRTKDIRARKPVQSCGRWRKLKLMSSPKKKSIREARLERIEKLLEEHEKSTSLSPWTPLLLDLGQSLSFHVLIVSLCSSSFCCCALCDKKIN